MSDCLKQMEREAVGREAGRGRRPGSSRITVDDYLPSKGLADMRRPRMVAVRIRDPESSTLSLGIETSNP